MAKRRRETTEKSIKQRLKEGRGQGRGAEYKPWLNIQDVPSQGLVHRIKGWKTGRVHHLLSKLELSYFYILEWSPRVVDIREQYPLLPLAETLALAEQCGVRHPTDPKSQKSIVITTDFLITLLGEGRPIEQARTVKPAQALLGQRIREKLEIERRFWERRQMDWGVVTEREIPQVLANNIELLHAYRDLSDRLDISDIQLQDTEMVLTRAVMNSDVPLREITARCDRRLGFEPGVSLTVAYHMLATRQWQIDLNQPLDPGGPLAVQASGKNGWQKGLGPCCA
ncbi:MAG: heteromeric transposase endonuclease subunit TnsA [Anaerolineae bacterium]|nr:heteromeric transposase endonuclease subunit TnsA [Anaerolineae bacterium]